MRVSVQVEAVPQLDTLQLAKDEPKAADAVSVTCVPDGKLALQVPGQLIPDGALVTVPVPVPALLTVSVGAAWTAVKVALTLWLALSVKVQVDFVPLQAPPQPVKVELVAGTAVRVICMPLLKLAVQVGPQLIPAGLLVTVPPLEVVTVN